MVAVVVFHGVSNNYIIIADAAAAAFVVLVVVVGVVVDGCIYIFKSVFKSIP